jgi:hypothetical protein
MDDQTIQQITERLKGIRPHGRGFAAYCPAHEDFDRALLIELRGGRLWFECQQGCDEANIRAQLGIAEVRRALIDEDQAVRPARTRRIARKCQCEADSNVGANYKLRSVRFAKNFRNTSSQLSQRLLMGSAKYANTTGDCAIVALMHVIEQPYDTAYQLLKPYRTCDCSGTDLRTAFRTHDLEKHFVPLGCFMNGRTTLANFVYHHPKGRYVILVPAHALAVIDGRVYDHTLGPNRLVIGAYRYDKRNGVSFATHLSEGERNGA